MARETDKYDRGPTPDAQVGDDAATEQHRLTRQRKRSIAIAVCLLLLAALFYVATLVKMGSIFTGEAGS